MQYAGIAFFIVYIIIAIVVLTLLSRFVGAHERMAAALEDATYTLKRGVEERKK
jgi:Tfp pilus assembly protein PilX